MLMVIPGSDISRHASLMDRVFRFRHSIFVDEKGWTELRQPDGLERDRFDDVHAIHQICLRGDDIVGYQRLLPTTRPHLLSDVLTDLCHRRPPRGPRVFEWTRFCRALAAARCARVPKGRFSSSRKGSSNGGWHTGSIPSRSRSIGVSWSSPCSCAFSYDLWAFPSASAATKWSRCECPSTARRLPRSARRAGVMSLCCRTCRYRQRLSGAYQHRKRRKSGDSDHRYKDRRSGTAHAIRPCTCCDTHWTNAARRRCLQAAPMRSSSGRLSMHTIAAAIFAGRPKSS